MNTVKENCARLLELEKQMKSLRKSLKMMNAKNEKIDEEIASISKIIDTLKFNIENDLNRNIIYLYDLFKNTKDRGLSFCITIPPKYYYDYPNLHIDVGIAGDHEVRRIFKFFSIDATSYTGYHENATTPDKITSYERFVTLVFDRIDLDTIEFVVTIKDIDADNTILSIKKIYSTDVHISK